MTTRGRTISTLLGLATLAFPSAAFAQTGKVAGRISFSGALPAPTRIRMSEPKCMAQFPQGVERRQIDGENGGLSNVVVAVRNAPKAGGVKKTTPVVLDQVGCMYTPAAIALQTGQTLRIRNSDDLLHNVNARAVANARFNIAQPRKGMEKEVVFDKAETYFPVGCDVHPWMRAYVAVFDHPFFAVTKMDGSFEIDGLPPGEYEIEATHPTLKTMTGRASVKAGASAKFDLTFTVK
jgi:plastocyanin